MSISLKKISKININNGRKTQKVSSSYNMVDMKLKMRLQEHYSKIKLGNYLEYVNKLVECKYSNKYVKYCTNLCIINVNIDSKLSKYKYDIINRKKLPNDSRIIIIDKLFINIMNWCKKTSDVYMINTAIFIWISDRFIWDVENIDVKMPICLYACPRDKNYILIPDSTFIAQSTSSRYAKTGLTWEQQKRLFTSDIKDKHNIFFRGADTTYDTHNLRRYIFNRLKSETDNLFKNEMIYDFLTGENYESVAAFKKYKFMLNLPGHYPWSTRLKYLYLGRQYVINVRVFTYLTDGTMDDHYNSFVDYLVPDTNCINIDMKYYMVGSSESVDKHKYADKQNMHECNMVYDKIKRIYYKYKNKQPSVDAKVRKSYELINKLSTENIYKYYLQIAQFNQELGITTVNL